MSTDKKLTPGWYYMWVQYGSPKKFRRATLELIRNQWKNLGANETVIRKVKQKEFVYYTDSF